MMKRIQKPANLAVILTGLRSQGKTIVLAAGSFENLRPGDIRYLEDARSRGDYLVVGVSPSWPSGKGRRSSGKTVSAADRAQVVAGLRCVDYVVTFSASNAENLITTLEPGVFARNPQDGKSVPEKKLLEEKDIQFLFCGEGRRIPALDLAAKLRPGRRRKADAKSKAKGRAKVKRR